MDSLPLEIVNKIMLFNSHPLADIVREEGVFKYRYLKLERGHGSSFDRGCSDAYYWREDKPHKWVFNDNKTNREMIDDLTDEEYLEYMIGYLWERDRKTF